MDRRNGKRHLFGGKCFTLIELLVVVAIIAVLVAVLLPALTRARASAQQVACASQMKQYANAIVMYGIDYDQIPFFHFAWGGPWKPETFWFNVLNPYLGTPDDYPIDPGQHLDARGTYPQMRRCPTAWELGSYGHAWIGVNYTGFHFGPGPPLAPFFHGADISGGTVKASLPCKIERINDPASWMMLLDTSDQFVYTPRGWPFDRDLDGDGVRESYHALYLYNGGAPKVHMNGCNVALCDGHVERMEFATLWATDDAGRPTHTYWLD